MFPCAAGVWHFTTIYIWRRPLNDNTLVKCILGQNPRILRVGQNLFGSTLSHEKIKITFEHGDIIEQVPAILLLNEPDVYPHIWTNSGFQNGKVDTRD